MPRSPGPARTDVVGHLGTADVHRVRELVAAAVDADGISPLNEHVLLHLRYGGDAEVRHVLRWEGDALVGYGHLDVTDRVAGASAEMVVHPAARRTGHGRAVVAALRAEAPDDRLRLWAHGGHPGAQRLAESMGFARERTLWQMRRSLAAPLPEPRLPEGVTVRTFRPGQDDAEWVALNARAFAAHPEQGRMTLEDLHVRMREPWFDPDGFFVAERRGGERGTSEPTSARMVGFHWTKIHGDGHPPVGEVYVLGVDPDAQGGGLGRTLTLVGLRHLQARGLGSAMLYVEADNTPAIAVYESLGFSHWDTDVMFRAGPSGPRATTG